MNRQSTSTPKSPAISANPTISADEVEQALNSVMQILIDSEEAFQRLRENVKDPILRRYFLEESSMRAQFRSELQAVLMHEGLRDNTDNLASANFGGALHRVWTELKSALGVNDHTLLVTVEQEEGEAKEAYRKAFETPLPYPVLQLLTAQAGHVQASHDFVRAARENTR